MIDRTVLLCGVILGLCYAIHGLLEDIAPFVSLKEKEERKENDE